APIVGFHLLRDQRRSTHWLWLEPLHYRGPLSGSDSNLAACSCRARHVHDTSGMATFEGALNRPITRMGTSCLNATSARTPSLYGRPRSSTISTIGTSPTR